MGLLILFGIGLIVWGLLSLFARDLVRSLQRFFYRMEGIAEGTSPFREEEQETVFRWNGATFTP